MDSPTSSVTKYADVYEIETIEQEELTKLNSAVRGYIARINADPMANALAVDRKRVLCALSLSIPPIQSINVTHFTLRASSFT